MSKIASIWQHNQIIKNYGKTKRNYQAKGSDRDLSFYKTKDGYMAKEKSGIDKKRIATDPAFQRTRENWMEFGKSGKAGKTLRLALRQYLQIASDSRVTSRLTSEMMRINKTDNVNDRGQRQVYEGDLTLMAGFDFNVGGKLSSTLFAPFQMNVDRVSGKATILLESFIPDKDVAFPYGTTHMKMIAGLAQVDFANEQSKFFPADTGDILVGPQEETPVNLEMNFPVNSDKDLFLVLGVEFMQHVNGKKYQLKNGAFNALTIVAVAQKE